jgi:bifunctional DNA-binding transcriptional regulator/antitoxin component of YhaV-PrlF toxin-antitoxin module
MGKGALYMPLTKQETFKAKLQRHNRLAVPTLLRWRYKMEPGELLKVTVKPIEPESYGEEEFLAKTATDGRLTIPKLTMKILEQNEEKSLAGAIFEVTISPAGNPNDAVPPPQTNPPESTETKLLDKIKDIRKNL